MKAKHFLCKLCGAIFAVCILAGIFVMKPVQSVVADTVKVTDVSASMKMSYEGNGDSTYSDGSKYNWWQISVKFDGFGLPKGATSSYFVNDHATDYTALDVMSYIVIDEVTPTETDKDSAYFGKTAREIVNANANNALNKAYGGPAIDKMVGVYGPISVYFTSSVIRIRGCTEFVAKENLKLTFLGGYSYAVSDTQEYTWAGCTYAYQNDSFSEVIEEVDVTEKVQMNYHSNTNGVVEIDLGFDGVNNIYPAGVRSATYVNDNANKGSVDLMQYIKIGNKTARELVQANKNGTTSYSGGSFPMTNGGVYAPVAVLMDNNGVIRIRVLTAYCAYEDLSITLTKGLKWTSTSTEGKVSYTTNKDVTYCYANGYFYSVEKTKDVSDKISLQINNTTNNTPAKDGTYTTIWMSFDGVEQVLHAGASGSFWVNDNPTNNSNGVDLMKYIYINGKSARSIVSANTIYTGLVLQSKVFGPVAIGDYDGRNIQIYIRNDYINYSDLFITLKSGLAWETKAGELLTTSSDETFCVKAGTTVFENVEKALAEDSFDMMKGASVRTSGYAGIRFSALYNAEDLNYWMNNNGCTVEVGMLLTTGAQLTEGEELTFNTVNKIVLPCSNNNEEVRKDGTYRFNGGISPVKDVSSYTKAYVGRAYVKITVGDLVFYKYATVNDNVRTIAFVAQEALNDSESGLTATEREFLQKIVNGEAVA